MNWACTRCIDPETEQPAITKDKVQFELYDKDGLAALLTPGEAVARWWTPATVVKTISGTSASFSAPAAAGSTCNTVFGLSVECSATVPMTLVAPSVLGQYNMYDDCWRAMLQVLVSK
jgi:hypothetical protein